MASKVLTSAATMEIKRLRTILDHRGNPKYSQMKIAGMLGVSETTVFRVLNHGGAYGAVPEVKTDAEAEASLAKFKAMNPHMFNESAINKLNAVAAEVQAPAKAANAMLDELDAGYLE